MSSDGANISVNATPFIRYVVFRTNRKNTNTLRALSWSFKRRKSFSLRSFEQNTRHRWICRRMIWIQIIGTNLSEFQIIPYSIYRYLRNNGRNRQRMGYENTGVVRLNKGKTVWKCTTVRECNRLKRGNAL